MSSSDTKHTEHVPLVATDSETDVTQFDAVELNPRPTIAELPIETATVAVDDKEDGPIDYAELSLHLNAPDKYGVAFQLGGLLALHARGLLDHVRFIHGGGYSNFIVAQFVLAIYAKAGYPLDGNTFEYTTGWKPVLSDFRGRVVDTIVDHLLLVDQESTVMRRRVCRPWKWRHSWNRGFEEWYRDDWPHAGRLEDALQFVSTARRASPTVPLFTINAADEYGGSSVVTDKEPPAIVSAEDLPGNIANLTAASTVVAPRLLLMASVFGGPFAGATLTSTLPMDPLMLYPYETYFMATRGPQRPQLQNDRCIVLDAFSRSYSDRHGGLTLRAYTESQVVKITEAPVDTTAGAKPGRAYTTTPALHRHGYVRMHARGGGGDAANGTLSALVTARTTPVSMLAIDELDAKLLVNWGYVCTMKQFGTPVTHNEQLPYPFHSDPAFEIVGTESAVDAPARTIAIPTPVDL